MMIEVSKLMYYYWNSDTVLSEDYICDDDEIIIQATVSEQNEEEVSNRYSSAVDPFAAITYRDLSDEKQLVSDLI